MPSDFRIPPFAAWRHVDARDGFEVVFFEVAADTLILTGCTTAVEAREPFAVAYTIELDEWWRTRRGRVAGRASGGDRSVLLEADGAGHWTVNGLPAPELDGCLDLDLESSALTNAFPVRRLALAPGDAAEAPAAYVRALDLAVARLEQRYQRVDDGSAHERYAYAAPAFKVKCELAYDDMGLVVDYPGLASRLIAP